VIYAAGFAIWLFIWLPTRPSICTTGGPNVQKVRLLVSRVWVLLLSAKHLFLAAGARPRIPERSASEALDAALAAFADVIHVT
jgi:hypothetical protein